MKKEKSETAATDYIYREKLISGISGGVFRNIDLSRVCAVRQQNLLQVAALANASFWLGGPGVYGGD